MGNAFLRALNFEQEPLDPPPIQSPAQSPAPRRSPTARSAGSIPSNQVLEANNAQKKSDLNKQIQEARLVAQYLTPFAPELAVKQLNSVLKKIETVTFEYGSEPSSYGADDSWKEEKTREINTAIDELKIPSPPIQVSGGSGGGRKNLLPKRKKSSKNRLPKPKNEPRTNRIVKRSKRTKRSRRSKRSKKLKK
tara:strand:+ start:83 stop:661 length:579 start_codon:yes stop_codon:yes gene_type:complete